MNYVPDLIPKDKKVLPEYFKGKPLIYAQGSSASSTIGYIGAIVCFFFSFLYISHLIVTFLFGVLGLIISPPGHYLIEKLFRFKFTRIVKISFSVLLVLVASFFIRHYDQIEKAAENLRNLKTQKEHEQKLADQKLEQLRIDSFNLRLKLIESLATQGNIEEVISLIDSESTRPHSQSEVATIDKIRTDCKKEKALNLVEKGDFKLALPLLNELLANNTSDINLLYNRALCLFKSGKLQEAVNDLRHGVESSDQESKNLYEKINPIKKRVVGYTTLCCDGTTSSAQGRGACSWHGGVCEWNHPIYQEYRKYEWQ